VCREWFNICTTDKPILQAMRAHDWYAHKIGARDITKCGTVEMPSCVAKFWTDQHPMHPLEVRDCDICDGARQYRALPDDVLLDTATGIAAQLHGPSVAVWKLGIELTLVTVFELDDVGAYRVRVQVLHGGYLYIMPAEITTLLIYNAFTGELVSSIDMSHHSCVPVFTATHVYYTGDNKLVRANLDGSNPHCFYTHTEQITSIVANATSPNIVVMPGAYVSGLTGRTLWCSAILKVQNWNSSYNQLYIPYGDYGLLDISSSSNHHRVYFIYHKCISQHADETDDDYTARLECYPSKYKVAHVEYTGVVIAATVVNKRAYLVLDTLQIHVYCLDVADTPHLHPYTVLSGDYGRALHTVEFTDHSHQMTLEYIMHHGLQGLRRRYPVIGNDTKGNLWMLSPTYKLVRLLRAP
jgi:hypothetical protein